MSKISFAAVDFSVVKICLPIRECAGSAQLVELRRFRIPGRGRPNGVFPVVDVFRKGHCICRNAVINYDPDVTPRQVYGSDTR